MTIDLNDWIWYGKPAHLIVADHCRFHLATEVGPWIVSTVGEYVSPEHSRDREWLNANPFGEEIGYKRKYETMVFRIGARCADKQCDCGMPIGHSSELDFAGANTPKEAEENHYELCKKWATKTLKDLEENDD